MRVQAVLMASMLECPHRFSGRVRDVELLRATQVVVEMIFEFIFE